MHISLVGPQGARSWGQTSFRASVRLFLGEVTICVGGPSEAGPPGLGRSEQVAQRRPILALGQGSVLLPGGLELRHRLFPAFGLELRHQLSWGLEPADLWPGAAHGQSWVPGSPAAGLGTRQPLEVYAQFLVVSPCICGCIVRICIRTCIYISLHIHIYLQIQYISSVSIHIYIYFPIYIHTCICSISLESAD